VHAAARLGELQRSVLDPAAAERELGWRAETPLGDGLRATWSWVKE
jgi:UDP-glucose 4-epimerase